MSRSENVFEKDVKGAESAVARFESNDSEQAVPASESTRDAEPQGKWTRSLFRFGPLSG